MRGNPPPARQASYRILGSLGQAGSMRRACMSMHGTSMQPRRWAMLSRLPLCTVSSKGLRVFCTQRYGTEEALRSNLGSVGGIGQLEAVCKAQQAYLL